MSQNILFWSTGGYTGLLNVEAMIGLALKLRGYNPIFVICDGVSKACASRFDKPEDKLEDWGKSCGGCYNSFKSILELLGLQYTTIGSWIPPQTREALYSCAQAVTLENYHQLTYADVSYGKTLWSSMLRQLRGVRPTKDDEPMLKEFAMTTLCSATAINNIISSLDVRSILTSHACYADWGPCMLSAVNRQVPVMTYMAGYVSDSFIFSWCESPDTVFRPVTDRVWMDTSSTPLCDDIREELSSFWNNRYKHKRATDLKETIQDYRGDSSFLSSLDLDPAKPTWGVMTHINWDTCGDYYPMIYSTFDEWVVDTIRTASEIKDVNWLIKVHPAEESSNPNTGTQSVIQRNFPVLPPHIKLLPYSFEVNPLDFLNSVNGVVTTFGTAGMEASYLGKPAILAGRPHYGNRGFTYDANTIDDYRALLRQIPRLGPLSEAKQMLAEKYYALFFIRSHVPFQVMKNRWDIDFSRVNQLAPGMNKFMDFLCERLISRGDFVMPTSLSLESALERTKLELLKDTQCAPTALVGIGTSNSSTLQGLSEKR